METTTCYYHCDNNGLSKVKFHVFSNKNENGEPYTLLRNGRALLDKEKELTTNLMSQVSLIFG